MQQCEISRTVLSRDTVFTALLLACCDRNRIFLRHTSTNVFNYKYLNTLTLTNSSFLVNQLSHC